MAKGMQKIVLRMREKLTKTQDDVSRGRPAEAAEREEWRLYEDVSAHADAAVAAVLVKNLGLSPAEAVRETARLMKRGAR